MPVPVPVPQPEPEPEPEPEVASTDRPPPFDDRPPHAAPLDDLERRELPPLDPLPTGTMAVVGKTEIPMAAFSAIFDLKVKKYADRGRTIPRSAERRYRKSIAERLIYHEILAQRVAEVGIEYDPAASKERKTQQKRGIRDWEKHLERRGETEASLEAMVIAELRERALLEHMGRLTVTEAEVDEDYEKIRHNWKSDRPRIRASHILVPIGPREKRGPRSDGGPPPSDAEVARWTKEARRKAKKIHAKAIKPKADFAALAEQFSDGPSARKGGDIGIFTEDRMVEEFSDKAFSMKVGEVSEPVKTKFGFHIIKVTGAWPAGDLPREALADQITDRLRQRKLHQGRRQLKEELVAATTVHNFVLPTLGPEPRRRRKKGK